MSTAKNGRYTYIEKVSVAGENVLENLFPAEYTHPVAKKMTISVNQDCVVLINGRDRVKIKPDLGLSLEYDDIEVKSLVTETDGVNFYAIVAY